MPIIDLFKTFGQKINRTNLATLGKLHPPVRESKIRPRGQAICVRRELVHQKNWFATWGSLYRPSSRVAHTSRELTGSRYNVGQETAAGQLQDLISGS